jgi:hypothetical protein
MSLKDGVGMLGMIISMDDSEATSPAQIRAFLAGSGEVRFSGQHRGVARMTGLSRAQVTPLIAGYTRQWTSEGGAVSADEVCDPLTKSDVELLAYVDKSHGRLSGPATRRILEREYAEYNQSVYERLAGISGATLPVRNSEAYRQRNATIPIGERRKPRPQGRSGHSAHRHRSSGRPGRRQAVPSMTIQRCRRRIDTGRGGKDCSAK